MRQFPSDLFCVVLINLFWACTSSASGGTADTGVSDARNTEASALRDGAEVISPHVDAAVADVISRSNPDAGTPVVHPCDMLGSNDAWENITPPIADLGPRIDGTTPFSAGITVDPRNPGTLYASTSASNSYAPSAFWKSTNCGATWTRPATGTNGSALSNPGVQWQITVDPINSDVYTSSFYGTGHFYRSQNGGVDWTDITPNAPGVPSFVQGWAMDPTDHTHLLAWFHAECTAAGGHTCIAESNDGATTWRIIPGPADGFVEGFGLTMLDATHWAAGIPFNQLAVTDNAGATWSQPIAYPGCFAYNNVEIAGRYYVGCFAENGIQSSSDGVNWMHLANSPSTGSLVVTGRYVYADSGGDHSGHPLSRASLTDLTNWASSGPPLVNDDSSDGGSMAYDSSHHVLYLTAQGYGIWRVVTE